MADAVLFTLDYGKYRNEDGNWVTVEFDENNTANFPWISLSGSMVFGGSYAPAQPLSLWEMEVHILHVPYNVVKDEGQWHINVPKDTFHAQSLEEIEVVKALFGGQNAYLQPRKYVRIMP